MRDGYQRLNPVFMAFVEKVVIELETLLIRLKLIAVRKDPGPGNGGTEHLEAHFGKQLDIFFIPVVEINPHQLHIILGRHFGDRSFDALRSHVLGGPALAVLIICAFTLVSRYCAAP
ncbi:hypothetical protein D3C81_1353480 [compost metagenome]